MPKLYLDSLRPARPTSTRSSTATLRVIPPTKNFRLFSLIFNLLLILLLLSVGFTARSTNFFTITSGSMEPAIHVGSLIATTPQTSYQPGDILAFHSAQGIVTHRLLETVPQTSEILYRTQGDANSSPDRDLINSSNVIGRVSLNLPYLGYLLLWLHRPLGFAFLILLPATLVVLQEVRSLLAAWREIRHAKPSFPPAFACLAGRQARLSLASLLLLALPFSTYALFLSPSVSLTNNSFSTAAVFPSPTPTPTPSPEPSVVPEPSPEPSAEPSPEPTPCSSEITSNFSNENTGPGSTNTNSLDVDINCQVTHEETVTSETKVTINANTGGNSQTGNTESGDISSGDITIDLNITNP
jgi:signal peptidase